MVVRAGDPTTSPSLAHKTQARQQSGQPIRAGRPKGTPSASGPHYHPGQIRSGEEASGEWRSLSRIEP